MKIEDFEELNTLLRELKKLIAPTGWSLENINIQYVSQEQVNILLIKEKEKNK